MPRPTRETRYTIERAAVGKRRAIAKDVPTLGDAVRFARHQLSSRATIIEREILPLGCEAIARVGSVTPDGVVQWSRR